MTTDDERKTPMSDTKLTRPDPARWFWYVYGGTLGPRYRAWVLHDLTGRTRWARQVARTTAVLIPLAAAGLLIAGPTWITWLAILGGLGLALMYALSYIDQSAEHRLLKHGFPDGTLQKVLTARNADATAVKMRRYDSMYRHAPTAGG